MVVAGRAAAHLPFFLVLLGLTVARLVEGRFDLALEDRMVNHGVNAYPIAHHRHTRARILALLERRSRGKGRAGSPESLIQF